MPVIYREVDIRFKTNAVKATHRVDRMSKSINKAKMNAHKFSSTIKRVLIGMATFKIVTSTYFLVTRFAASLVTINSLLEQTRVKLTFMGRSAEYAKQRIADMKKITVTTALTMLKLSSAASIMSGFGIDMNRKWMRAMADVVAITQIDTGKLALMIGKASVGMKQTINRSFGQIGISPLKLKSEYAKVHNWAKAVYNVITAQFGGASKTIEGTFEQVITNLQDRFTFVSARLGRVVFNLIRKHGVELSNMLDNLSRNKSLDKMAVRVGAVYQFIASITKEVIGYMASLWRQYGNDVVKTFSDIAILVVTIFSINGTMSLSIMWFFRRLFKRLARIALILDALRLIKDVLTGDFKQLSLDVQLLGASAVGAVHKLGKGAAGVARTAISGISKLIKWNWPKRNGVTDFLDTIDQKLQRTQLGLKANINYYNAYAEGLKKQGAVSIFADMIGELSDNLTGANGNATELIDKIRAIAAAAMKAAQSVKDFNPSKMFSKGMSSVLWSKDKLKSFNRLLSFMKTLFSGIESALAGMNKQTKIWKSLLGAVMKTIQQLAAKMVTLSIIYLIMSALGMGLNGLGFMDFLKSQMFGVPLQEMNTMKTMPNRGLQMFPGFKSPGDFSVNSGSPTAAGMTVVVNGDIYGYDDFSDKVKTVFRGLA